MHAVIVSTIPLAIKCLPSEGVLFSLSTSNNNNKSLLNSIKHHIRTKDAPGEARLHAKIQWNVGITASHGQEIGQWFEDSPQCTNSARQIRDSSQPGLLTTSSWLQHLLPHWPCTTKHSDWLCRSCSRATQGNYTPKHPWFHVALPSATHTHR